jgi:tetratricopeptide (TPR) repeat protein
VLRYKTLIILGHQLLNRAIMGKDFTTLVSEATAAMKSKDWLTAVNRWHHVRILNPHYAPAYDEAAVALRNVKRFGDADVLLETSAKQFGSTSRRLIAYADTAMDAGNWLVALQRWEVLRKNFPQVPQGYYRAASALLRSGDPQAAESLLLKGYHQLTDTHLVTKALAIYYAERKLDAKALLYAAQLRVTHPKDPAGFSVAANVLLRQKNMRGLQQLFSDEPTDTVFHTDFTDFLNRVLSSQTPLPLQEIIECFRMVWRTGARPPRHAQALSLFDRAQHDSRLRAVLDGRAIKPANLTAKHPIRAVYYLPSVTQSDNLLPLYDFMHSDPRFAPIILCSRDASPFASDAYGFYTSKYPAHKGHHVVDGGPHVHNNITLYDLQPDIVFYHTPYSMDQDLPFYLRVDFVARHSFVSHINYGNCLLTIGAQCRHVYSGPHVQYCDFVFAENLFCAEEYKRLLPKQTVVCSGYTKTDVFRKHTKTHPPAPSLLMRKPLRIIWTPHWQTRDDPTGGTQTSNFLLLHEDMLEVATWKGVELHIRPHPLLRSRLSITQQLSTEHYDNIMERFVQRHCFIHSGHEGASYIQALMQSTVLISDFSSLIPEFLVTRRPIIFCRTDDVWSNGKWIGSFGKNLIETCCYISDDASSAKHYLRCFLDSGEHPLYKDQERFIQEHNLYPEECSSGNIADYLYAQLRSS